MIKRVALFLITNFAVLLVLGIIANLLGLTKTTTQLTPLLMFAALFGFGGAFISLLMSKSMAKLSTGAHIITHPSGETERWLISTVSKLAQTAGIGMPEVGIYDGAPNAFATGATRNNALVCVSSGLLASMDRNQIEAVLGHEIAHVANGDMVTLTLIQGIVNTFVLFLSRAVASVVAHGGRNDQQGGSAMAYMITSLICQVLFGVLASIIVNYFSRQREYRADAGSAYLLGNTNAMISALRQLERIQTGQLPESMAAFGIEDRSAHFLSLFASHPPLSDRIKALEERRYRLSLDA